MKKLLTLLFTVAVLLIATTSWATATASMTNQMKNDSLTGGTTGTIKMALFVAASSTLSATTTTYSTTGELATAHGYTQGGSTLTGCSTVTTSAANAADWTCTGGNVWTSSDSTGIGPADTVVIYNSTNSHVLGIYSITSSSATGTGATFTVTFPTVATGTRGALYFQ